MMESSDLHNIADVAGILISGPVILAMIRGFMAFGRIESVLENMSKNADHHSKEVEKILDDHEDRIRKTEFRVGVVYEERHTRLLSPTDKK